MRQRRRQPYARGAVRRWVEARPSDDGNLSLRACSPKSRPKCHGWRLPSEVDPRLVRHFDAHPTCRGRRSGSGQDTRPYGQSGAVPAPCEKPLLVALARQSTGRGNLSEGDHARLRRPHGRTSVCPDRCHARGPAARHCTPISRTTWNLLSTMAAAIVRGRPSRHLVPKDQSMTLPMPAWENVEDELVADRSSPSCRHKCRCSRRSADRRDHPTRRMTPMFCPLPSTRGVPDLMATRHLVSRCCPGSGRLPMFAR